MYYPRVLVISNNSFNKSDSNGRTLMNFFMDYPKENIAQFYLHGEPDFDICANYYCVSDKDSLRAFKSLKSYTKDGSVKHEVESKTTTQSKKQTRTCRTMFLRDIVWRSYRWWNKYFNNFIQKFNPEVVLLQAGDCPFMYNITRRVSKKYGIPIIMYNSENYVLKNKMYSNVKRGDFWHAILKKRLKKEYKKIMKAVSHCIYSTEYLEDCYQKAYLHEGKSTTLYTVTDMKDCSSKHEATSFNLLYCGNLGVGRVYPLDELAKTLALVDKNAKLKIFGKFTDEQSQKLVCDNQNVVYGGVVPYEQVPEEIKSSSMVVHTENPERLQNLLGAFSTKIADCLACGKPFLVYALREYPFVKYLEQNNAAHIAEDVDELKVVLGKCLKDIGFRNQFLKNSKKLAEKNHRVKENCRKMVEILKKVVTETND